MLRATVGTAVAISLLSACAAHQPRADAPAPVVSAAAPTSVTAPVPGASPHPTPRRGHSPYYLRLLGIKLATAADRAGIELSGFGPSRGGTAIELLGPEVSTDPATQERMRRIAEKILPPDMTVRFIPDEGTGVTFPAIVSP